MPTGQTIAQRLASGHGAAPVHDSHYIHSRNSDGHEFVGDFDQLTALVTQLQQAALTGVTLPLALTDVIYVIRGGVIQTATVADILNINLTTTTFAVPNLNAVLAHSRGVILESTAGTAQTITLPADTGNPAVDFPLNATIEGVQVGVGQLSFVLAGGVTSLAPNGAKARTQGSSIYARRRAPNIWHITGDTTP